MSDWRVWLTCTRSGCKHKRTHRTPEEATRAARIFMADFVTHNGHTVCACHPESEAEALGVEQWVCDEAPAAPSPSEPR